jgi:hypothetical protein
MIERLIPDMQDDYLLVTLTISSEGREHVHAALPPDHIGRKIADQLCYYGIRVSERGGPAGPEHLAWLFLRLEEHVIETLMRQAWAGPDAGDEALEAIKPHLRTMVRMPTWVRLFGDGGGNG